MRASPKGIPFFVQWSLGILSSLCVATIIALGHTVLKHEIEIELIRADCPKLRKRAELVLPEQRPTSILSYFGFGPNLPAKETKSGARDAVR